MQRNNSLLYLKELMTYTVKNFKTGKAVKDAVAAGVQVHTYEPGIFQCAVKDGTVYLEGPHYPKPHRWYLSAQVKDGFIVKINK